MADQLYALSVKQPWAWAIATQGKDVENRTWKTTAEPPVEIAIHASRAYDADAMMPTEAAARALLSVASQIRLAGRVVHDTRLIGAGGIIAVATLTGWHHATTCAAVGWCSPWAQPGQWHWRLGDVRALERPVPCKGRLGLWPVPGQVQRAVMGQLEASHA